MSKKPILYIHHVENVLNLFYRKELRWDEEVIDNRETLIAKELNLKISMVSYIIAEEMMRKIKVLNDRINPIKEVNINDLEVEYEEVKVKTFLNKKRPTSSSQYRGVCWRKDRRKWQANITINGKQTHIGLFKHEIQAFKAFEKREKLELIESKPKSTFYFNP